MYDRTEFSSKIRLAAWKRSGGRCEKCGAKLYPGKFAFDHIKPDGLGGRADISNCQCLCDSCHGTKTHTVDRPIMTKADNQRKAHLGLKPKGRGFQTNRSGKYKQKIGGEIVVR